jgi:hypothetical protein
MIEVKRRQLHAAYRSDADFAFLRVTLDGPGDAPSALAAWHRSISASLGRRAWIGAPIDLDQGTWVIDVEGAESYETLMEIVDDLAQDLEKANLHGTITREPPRYSSLDAPLDRFALTVVGASLTLSRASEHAAARRGLFNRSDLEPNALAAAADHAIEWCTALNGDLFVAVDVLSVEADPRKAAQVMTAALRNPERAVHITASQTSGIVRRVTFTRDGHILFHFGNGTSYASASDTAAQVEDLFERMAPWVDYGCSLQTFEASVSYMQMFRTSWPELPGFPAHFLPDVRALESSLVPDAFGLQLLGPTHPLEAATLSQYTVRPAPAGRVILRHQDIGNWLDGTLPPPQAIDLARRELGPLLMQREQLEEAWRRLGVALP